MPFDCCQQARVRFTSQPEAPFHRSDANDDDELNISDPVFVRRAPAELLHGAVRILWTPCPSGLLADEVVP